MGTMGVVACERCRIVRWWEGARPLDPSEGIARSFGSFELVDRLPALRAPAREVLVYRPPSRRARSRLSGFPPHQWLLAADDLWMCHDGETLQLCPTNPLLADNLGRLVGQHVNAR